MYRYTKERNINELCHNSMYGYENNRNSPMYRYTRTAPKFGPVTSLEPDSSRGINVNTFSVKFTWHVTLMFVEGLYVESRSLSHIECLHLVWSKTPV